MSAKTHEAVRIWSPAGLPGVEVMHGTTGPAGVLIRVYLESYSIFSNPVDDDVRRYRGRTYESGGRMVDLAEPGEVVACTHQRGFAVLNGLFIDPRVFESAAREMDMGRVPHFAPCAVADALLYRAFRAFHRALRDPLAVLQHQSLFAEAMRFVMERRSEQPPAAPQRDHAAVRRAREFLHAHWADEVALEDVAGAAYASKYHLVRTFKEVVGVPPHEYQRHLRVARARRMLAAGQGISATAYACGFADQAHLTRTFRRALGVTPGQYRTGAT